MKLHQVIIESVQLQANKWFVYNKKYDSVSDPFDTEEAATDYKKIHGMDSVVGKGPAVEREMLKNGTSYQIHTGSMDSMIDTDTPEGKELAAKLAKRKAK